MVEESAAVEAGGRAGHVFAAGPVPNRNASDLLPRSLDRDIADASNAGIGLGHGVGHMAEQRELASVLQAA